MRRRAHLNKKGINIKSQEMNVALLLPSMAAFWIAALVEGCHWFISRSCLDLHKVCFWMLTSRTFFYRRQTDLSDYILVEILRSHSVTRRMENIFQWTFCRITSALQDFILIQPQQYKALLNAKRNVLLSNLQSYHICCQRQCKLWDLSRHHVEAKVFSR